MTFAAAERTRASEAFSSETRIVRSCDRRRVREKIEVRACSYLRSHAGARRDELAPFGAGKAESAARGGVAELAGGLFLARRRLRRLRRLQHAGQGRGAAAAGLGQTRRLVTLGEIVALVGARRAFPQRRERRAGTEKHRTEKHRARGTPARAVRCAGFLSPPARRRGPRASRKRVRRKRATLRGRVGRARNVAREPSRSRVLALSVVRCGGTPRARSGLQMSQRRRCVSRARAIRACGWCAPRRVSRPRVTFPRVARCGFFLARDSSDARLLFLPHLQEKQTKRIIRFLECTPWRVTTRPCSDRNFVTLLAYLTLHRADDLHSLPRPPSVVRFR